MASASRLAAYLSGDLDADEQAAVEAELAADPALRARLERIRRADAALAGLPDEALSAEAEQQLHAAVDAELDAVLGDELAARRARRTLPRWVPATAAAALVLVVGTGVVLTGQMGGSDESADTMAGAPEAAQDDAGDGEEAADAQLGAGEGSARTEAAPVGPRVVSAGRTLDAATLGQIAADPMVLEAVGGTAPDDPAATAAAHARVLGVDPADYLGEDVPEEDRAGSDPTVVSEGEVTDSDLADVARCLPVLQEDASSVVVPLYAELGEDDEGTDVLAYAALAPDDTGDYQRVEVWLVERSSCSLLRFVQHDR